MNRRYLTALLTFILLSSSTSSFLNQEELNTIRESALFETYDMNENPFKDYTEEEIKSMLGTTLEYPETNPKIIEIDKANEEAINALPKAFDSRTYWESCRPAVRNQLKCGSCWAFAGAVSLSNRFCIAAKGKIKPVLSPQDSISCDYTNLACNGGYLNNAWKYYENFGIVTDKCFPYLSGSGQIVPKCIKTCMDRKSKYVKYKVQLGTSRAFMGE